MSIRGNVLLTIKHHFSNAVFQKERRTFCLVILEVFVLLADGQIADK